MNVFGISQIEIAFKKICYLISALSLTLGLYVYKVLDYTPMLYIELSIGTFFLMMPSFTKMIGLDLNISIFFIVLNSALVYYGVILGPLSEIHLLVVFLVGASVCLLWGKKLMYFPVTLVLLMLIFLELNYYYFWFKPLDIEYQKAIIVRWVVVFTGSLLSIVTFWYFAKQWVAEKSRRLITDLRKANESKSVYVRETSHELRTPLSSIFGIAQLLHSKRNTITDPELKKEIEYLFESAFIATKIVDNILDMSKIEAGKFDDIKAETIDLQKAIETCMVMQRYVASTRGIKINLDYDKQLPPYIITDKIALYKVINNLSSNLVKYAPEQSNVEIKIFGTQETIFFQTKNSGSISAEGMKTIFEPFASSNDTLMSTGLGLPITKHIVQLLGGDITVECIDGNTIFKLSIPLIAGCEKDLAASDRPFKKGSLKGYRILCIDDDPIQQHIIKVTTQMAGAEPIVVDSGEAAFDFLNSENPALIICDANMPFMNGKQFLSKLKSTTAFSHIPVIIISGDAFETEKEEMLKAGADEYLTKPFHFTTFYSILQKYLPPIRILLVNK
ncbi:ATP-binding response regulator [Chitinophaga sp. RAB17]|uniref:ATP-binding response regulator n=1 Tax=Chitinophaga sp. RAB17 TaxID=3233049 RepID=UPI003F91851C